MGRGVLLGQEIAARSDLTDHINAHHLSADIETTDDPLHIANDLIAHDDRGGVAEQSLPQITDVVNQVGPVQCCQQSPEGMLHGRLRVKTVGITANR